MKTIARISTGIACILLACSGCRENEVPVIVSPWAQYDFSAEELACLKFQAERNEDAAAKLAMYYTGIDCDEEKKRFWENRAFELYQQKNHYVDNEEPKGER